MRFDDAIHLAAQVVEATGVAILLLGTIAMLVLSVVRAVRDGPRDDHYRFARKGIGRVVLLGLEVLVAGDIIRTVAIDPTLTSVAVLAAIVAIRTFLSWSIEMEIEGRLPWRLGGGG